MARALQLLTLSVALMGVMGQYQVPLQGKVWNKTFTYAQRRFRGALACHVSPPQIP